MTAIRMIEVSPAELADLINEGLKIHVENLLKQLSEDRENGKDFLSRKETAEFFNVSLVSIHQWVKDGLLHPYKMGNRTYFKRSELIERLTNSGKEVA